MQIIVDTAGNIQYTSFYLYALLNHFGNAVRFASAPFAGLDKAARGGHMCLVVREGLHERNIVIQYDDTYRINEGLYSWCDTYGHVNHNDAKTPENLKKKAVSLCPSFSIRYRGNTLHLLFDMIRTLPTSAGPLRKRIGKWKRTLRRPTYDQYRPTRPMSGYLFHCSTLWQSDEWNRNDQQVNLARAQFIRAARALEGVRFEGGLVSNRTDAAAHQFDDVLFHPVSPHEYLAKTQQSAFVFNTPAYWQCHGWKLGEYMALGKATISTPPSNNLPEPLIHGQHAHFIASPYELADAIAYLHTHPDYCAHLGNNLHQYWLRNGTPEATLARLGISQPRP